MNLPLEKRISSIHGFGIYTEKTILKDTAYYRVPLNTIYIYPKPRCARIGDNTYVSDDAVLNWINHSCHSNSKLNI